MGRRQGQRLTTRRMVRRLLWTLSNERLGRKMSSLKIPHNRNPMFTPHCHVAALSRKLSQAPSYGGISLNYAYLNVALSLTLWSVQETCPHLLQLFVPHPDRHRSTDSLSLIKADFNWFSFSHKNMSSLP